MASIKPVTYSKPAAAEKVNPYVESLAEVVKAGIDSAFAVEFKPGEYAAEKLLIQKAVNAHGFSAREVETDFDKDAPDSPVKSIFLVRPARKRKAEAAETAAD